ncbi:MAG: sericin-like [Gammaproteobacteria bacterium]|jgi:hypothetical protein|nr:sericin-like [Gammaproteobacteria bacterium]
MKKSAFVVRAHIRNVVLCSLLTFGLAACGTGEGSSSSGTASAASDTTPSLVSPNIGVVERTSATETPAAANTAQSATPISSTTPSSSSTTAVAASDKTSTNSSTPGKSNSPSTGVATLDWMPPTENTDGSVLNNLAGYTVYYGTSPSDLTQSVKITNPGLTAYTLSNLQSGTWYFTVTSYSSVGIESTRSGVVSTTI